MKQVKKCAVVHREGVGLVKSNNFKMDSTLVTRWKCLHILDNNPDKSKKTAKRQTTCVKLIIIPATVQFHEPSLI